MEYQVVYTVQELTEKIAEKLEYAPDLKAVWVKGEIAECTRSGMGHWYFNLKDSETVLKVVLFASQARKLTFTPTSGMEVLVQGSVSVYRARGVYQMLATDMETAGEGAYRKALLELMGRLEEQGIFAQKRVLPKYPLKIGVVTSESGAAIHDITMVLKRRWPLGDLELFSCLVQGKEAPQSIVDALKKAYKIDLDILILARGGGSAEDLWAFNDEEVAKTLFKSPHPTVTGVGHEIDRTIVDLVADYAAPTPSAAAEEATPDIYEVEERIKSLEAVLYHLTSGRLLDLGKNLNDHKANLSRYQPQKEIVRFSEKCASLETLLNNRVKQHLGEKSKKFLNFKERFLRIHPERSLESWQKELTDLLDRCGFFARENLAGMEEKFTGLEYGLELLNPKNLLKKGYAVVSKEKSILKSVSDTQKGDSLTIQLGDGELIAVVEDILRGQKNG